MNLSKQIAYACAALPMLLSISIFLLWLSWRLPILQTAGLVVIGVGLLLLLPGGLAFGNYVRLACRGGEKRPIWRSWSLYLIPLLLLVNLPLAVGMVSAAVYLDSQVTLTIVNRTPHRIDDHRLTGGDIEFELPPLDAGESVTQSFHPSRDGSIEYRRRAGDTVQSETFGYVTPGMGGNYEMEVFAEKIEVRSQ